MKNIALVFGITAILMFSNLPIPAQEVRNPKIGNEDQGQFARDTYDLSQIVVSFTSGGGKNPVEFDAAAAANAGYRAELIVLTSEMVAAVNELLSQAKRSAGEDISKVDVRRLYLDRNSYSALRTYFERSMDFKESADGKSNEAAISLLPTYQTCGFIGYPRPTRQAAWKTHSSSNPSDTLRNWGYHSTPNLVGGGWTRPQTYKWYLCGFNTYRDHAYPYTSSSLREQNYSGYTPRGEPNPEIYASGPWPYTVWPAYVLWWHQYGPGR